MLHPLETVTLFNAHWQLTGSQRYRYDHAIDFNQLQHLKMHKHEKHQNVWEIYPSYNLIAAYHSWLLLRLEVSICPH